MEPNRFGRKLGIGVRVASRMIKERAAQAGSQSAAPSGNSTQPSQASAPPPPPSPKSEPPKASPPPRKNYAEPARRVGVGTRSFGKAVAGPLIHISGTLWLEITGLFFALFAIFFGQNAWKTRASALHGPEHTHFLIYAVVTLVFIYFCVSSFLRARRRGRTA